ncbi:MAG: RNA polymerase sigma factor [Chloroflexota bacterium]|nr:RNA polymerase sigma factor [Chloroflexota bacterium]
MDGIDAVAVSDVVGEDSDALLARAASHDRKQFAKLYDRYVDRIERYVLVRTGRASDVDDIVSTTFMRALTNIHTFHRQRGTFAGWLFTIARNVVSDHQRALRHLSESEAADHLDTRPGPEMAALHAEEAAAVRRALLRLTHEQRDALALRYASELSFANVGQAMGKSEAAAKMLVQRGLQALRQQLEEI